MTGQRSGFPGTAGGGSGSQDRLDPLPVFEIACASSPALPIVIAVPHAGRAYPDSLVRRMREPEFSCLRLEDRYVDIIAREVAAATGAGLLIANAPRALIDLNRSPEDVDWSMVVDGSAPRQVSSLVNRRARSGLGIVPRRLPGLGEIWRDRLTMADLDARIDTVHRPYHQALAHMLESVRDVWGTALLIDLHSMPPLKSRSSQEHPPEFVIGDRFGTTCADHVSAAALSWLAGTGRAVSHNRPYAGGYVLERHSAPRRGVHAMQLEICRSTYLDARLSQPGPRLAKIVQLIAGLVRVLADEVVAGGSGEGLAMAAE